MVTGLICYVVSRRRGHTPTNYQVYPPVISLFEILNTQSTLNNLEE